MVRAMVVERNSSCWRAPATGLLVALVLSAWGRPAAACGACVCDDQPRAIINLIRDVPLNLEVPLRAFDAAQAPPRLERVADGMVVPATVTRDPSGAVAWWLKVDQDLEPNTEYRLDAVGQFTTGTTRDEQAPTFDEVGASAGGNGGLCDLEAGGQLTLSGANDGNAGFAVWVELEVEVNRGAQRVYTDYQFGSIRLGHSAMGCFGPTELAGISADQDYPGRVRLHDAAGNVSDWKTFVFTPTAEAPGGCGTPSGIAGAAGMGSGGNVANGAAAGSADADPDRMSKGCGCALGAERQLGHGASALGLASLLLFGRRPRRPRAPLGPTV